MQASRDKILPERKVIPAISHTAELEAKQRQIDDIDDASAKGGDQRHAYGRMITRLEAEHDSWPRCRSVPSKSVACRTALERELYASAGLASTVKGASKFLRN